MRVQLVVMLAVALCLLGLLIILVLAEVLAKYKILKGEYLRKFVHISAGCFIASWPWLISWRMIQVLAVGMIVVTVANHFLSFFHYHGHRASFGDIFFAVAVLVAALLTDNKVFFCVAILELAMADGLAAILGKAYGKRWSYRVFGHSKTLIGTMAFCIVSLFILGIGLLSQSADISFDTYSKIIIFVPLALTLVENLSVFGLDNLTLPAVTIALLQALQN